MTDTVRSRWLRKYNTARLFIARARKKHVAHPTVESRNELDRRKAEADYALRVLDRHKPTVKSAKHVSGHGVELIARFEGCELRPYQDAVGVWTIGFGHTHGVGPHTPPLKSRQEAMNLLRRDLDQHYAPAVAALPVSLKQNQFDALVSLVYNCGPGCIARGTTLGNALRASQWESAAQAFMLWVRAGGQVLPGLVYRRRVEAELFRGRG